MEEFRENPFNHPLIPFNGSAGAPSMGTAKKNRIQFKILAPKDSSKDQTKKIQKAIDMAARKGGGDIFLSPGIYNFDGRIHLHSSNTRIIGAGREKTFLRFRKSLTEIDPMPAEARGESGYAWNGGLIHIGPREDFVGKHLRQKSGWGADGFLSEAVGKGKRGDFSILVKNAEGIKADDYIFLTYENPSSHTFLNEIAGFLDTEKFNWEKDGRAWLKRSFPFPVRVVKVSQNTLTLADPLRVGFGAKWGVKIQKFVPVVENSSVESLSIEMISGETKEHLQELGFNAIFFHRAIDSWLQDIEIKNADNGILLNSTKNISIDNVAIDGMRRYHHAIFTKNTHDALVSHFEIRAPVIHGINSDSFGSGNVWSQGKMLHGTFDMHRGMQFDLIRTDIQIHNDAKAGGQPDAGPMQGRRVVNWNIHYSGKDDLVNQPDYYRSGLLLGLYREDNGALQKGACATEKKQNVMSKKNLFLEQQNIQINTR